MICSVLATVGLLFLGGKWIKIELERIIKEDGETIEEGSITSLLNNNTNGGNNRKSSYDAML